MSPVDTQTATTEAHLPAMNPNANDLKRKRSLSHEATLHPAPLPKAAKTSNHLQINYLVRQCEDDLPLVTTDDTLPNIIKLLNEYAGVLDRHESMACNLGARPLGPILVKRFDRLFEGPPKVVKSHGKEGTNVTWLDVVEFARNKPEQFQLGQMSEGVRVCQFYTKQCRVQISEEDYVLISSGIPHRMIPPQPIAEDEEKELGTLEILEKHVAQICQLADQVAARTRQLNHRLKGRKQAILDRRATASPVPPMRPASPSNVALMNGAAQLAASSLANLTQAQSQPPAGGFVPVNARPQADQNGSNSNGVSVTTRNELLSKFHTLSEVRQQSPNGHPEGRRASVGHHSAPHSASHSSSHSATPSAKPISKPPNPPPANITVQPAPQFSEPEINHLHIPTTPAVPIPNTPTSLLPNSTPRGSQPQEKDDGGPFKAEMMRKVEGLAKGARILPPCDRCRRLHMDCMKNLTACAGCTKKHAKCSWKEVRESELRGGPVAHPSGLGSASTGASEADETDNGFEKGSSGSPAPRSASGHGSGPGGPVLSPTLPHVGQPAMAVSPTTATSSFNMVSTDTSLPSRTSPPDKVVEQQLQEAAKSGLAHANAREHASANARLGVSEVA
jgi:hypothetical protein